MCRRGSGVGGRQPHQSRTLVTRESGDRRRPPHLPCRRRWVCLPGTRADEDAVRDVCSSDSARGDAAASGVCRPTDLQGVLGLVSRGRQQPHVQPRSRRGSRDGNQKEGQAAGSAPSTQPGGARAVRACPMTSGARDLGAAPGGVAGGLHGGGAGRPRVQGARREAAAGAGGGPGATVHVAGKHGGKDRGWRQDQGSGCWSQGDIPRFPRAPDEKGSF